MTAPVLALAVVITLALVPSVSAYEDAAVTDGGVLTGTVKFVGAPPKLEPLHVNKNREVCGETKPSEALVLAPGGGVRGSVIRIEGVSRGKKGEGELVIDNHRCAFVPHVGALMAGTRARVKNSDPVLHDTHAFRPSASGSAGKLTVFNLALPNAGQVIDVTKRLAKPGAVELLCDAHTHMSGWVYVHDSPYVAVTDERGQFRIDAVPPGTYRVTMWHEGFHSQGVDKDGRPLYEAPRTVVKEVTIPPRATATVDFELR